MDTNELKLKFQSTLESLKNELAQLRTGRASVELVENVKVDYFGTKAPLKQVGTITIPEPREIMISPWDKDQLTNVEKAITDSDLGLTQVNNGEVIIIKLPEMTEEGRKDMVKLLQQKLENARIALRTQREEYWKGLRKMQKDHKIGEDKIERDKEGLQKLIDEYNEQIEEMGKAKEAEILTV